MSFRPIVCARNKQVTRSEIVCINEKPELHALNNLPAVALIGKPPAMSVRDQFRRTIQDLFDLLFRDSILEHRGSVTLASLSFVVTRHNVWQ